MGLTSFKGSIVGKNDVGAVKNYLRHDKIDELNRIVAMYIDYAEDQIKKRKIIDTDSWTGKLDAFLEFNERDVLAHAGQIRMEVAQKLATERYEELMQVKKVDAGAADEKEIRELENFERKLAKRDRGTSG